MTARTGVAARSLIVLSKDYGQLAFAMALLRDQAFAAGARLLLPEHLYTLNGASLPVPAASYGTLEDILAAVDSHKPDLTFLLSGYLLPQDRLLSRRSLEALVHHLRQGGSDILTSDPFLGLAPGLTLAQIDTRVGTASQDSGSRWLTRFILRLLGPRTTVVRQPSLEHVTHLYAASVPDPSSPIPRASVFNPSVRRAAAAGGAPAGPPERPRWLFVLSATDVANQCQRLGLREFIKIVLDLLRYAVEVERAPMLIAPPAMVERLAPALRGAIEVVPFCSFPAFERRLLEAEYVFYWNAFSFSQLIRVANERPFFLFDRGHFSRTIKPFYEVGRAAYFGGWEPPYLDQRQLFSLYVLAHLAKAQAPVMRALRERWESSPTPDALVNQLLHVGIRREPA